MDHSSMKHGFLCFDLLLLFSLALAASPSFFPEVVLRCGTGHDRIDHRSGWPGWLGVF